MISSTARGSIMNGSGRRAPLRPVVRFELSVFGKTAASRPLRTIGWSYNLRLYAPPRHQNDRERRPSARILHQDTKHLVHRHRARVRGPRGACAAVAKPPRAAGPTTRTARRCAAEAIEKRIQPLLRGQSSAAGDAAPSLVTVRGGEGEERKSTRPRAWPAMPPASQTHRSSATRRPGHRILPTAPTELHQSALKGKGADAAEGRRPDAFGSRSQAAVDYILSAAK
jgi:hypothetical protein